MIQVRVVKSFPPRRESAPFRLDVAFEAHPGITVLFGPSGAGKSLTLDCIAGFAEPDQGRIEVDGAIVFDSGARVSLPPQARRCGYVFQNYALFPHMSLQQNLTFAAASAGMPRPDRPRRVAEMLQRFRLEEVGGRRPHEVSGGQKQRCSIARALIGSPRVLLLDEPARGLDAPLRAELYDVLREVRAEYDTPVLLVTHSLEEALELGDRMLALVDGKVAQAGTPAQVCSAPASLDLAHLMGIFNVIPVEIRALDPGRNTGVVRWGDYDFQTEYLPGFFIGDRVKLLAAPRQLSAMPRAGRIGPNQVPLQLLHVVDLGHALRLEFSSGVTVEIPPGGPLDRNNGDWVVEFPTHGLRVLRPKGNHRDEIF